MSCCHDNEELTSRLQLHNKSPRPQWYHEKNLTVKHNFWELSWKGAAIELDLVDRSSDHWAWNWEGSLIRSTSALQPFRSGLRSHCARMKPYETLHTVSHWSHKALSMTWYQLKMLQHAHMLGFGIYSLSMTASQSLSKVWNCTGMAFSQGSLVSQSLLPALAWKLQHCRQDLTRH